MLGPNEVCPPGHEITDAYRCNEAGHWTVSLGLFPMRPTYVRSKRCFNLPFGCSSQVGGDDTIHFCDDAETDNARFTSTEFVMICEKGFQLVLYYYYIHNFNRLF